jgi:GR25 family glycosyltransferase involved in LPS biosynthesis
MNLTKRMFALDRFLYRLGLQARRLLPRQRCHVFGPGAEAERIGRVYVINLDRQPDRWAAIRRELDQVLDGSGHALSQRTMRFPACDTMSFAGSPRADDEVNPIYTLRDQLFVEPQPRVLPDRFELDRPIRMSWQEVAVARSHIAVWRQIATGEDAYALVLEDDAWFKWGFGQGVDRTWREIVRDRTRTAPVDLLYLSYKEVTGGAQKTLLSASVFRPVRGLWYLSGYVLSRQGARKLIRLLPCWGPVDLWINHQFHVLEVRATRRSVISQRSDWSSANSYSILPVLSRIGVLDCEAQSLFQNRPQQKPVFAFGDEGSGLTSLAMALSMLGYRCCSDLQSLPDEERAQLLSGSIDRVFDAYVNIGALMSSVATLRERYPGAKFIVTASKDAASTDEGVSLPDGLSGAEVAVLHLNAVDKWKTVCEHLRCAPPACAFPEIADLGQRPVLDGDAEKMSAVAPLSEPRRDTSPWVVEPRCKWSGIRTCSTARTGSRMVFDDPLESLDRECWLVRNDTFPGNLGLFRPANVEYRDGGGVLLNVRRERLGVRDFSAASISSRDRFLYGRFETTLQASKVPGVITGFFLHRNSPRQEIDVEIVGKRSDCLLVNVFYNPGTEGSRFDYGYRGAPTIIHLGFDVSASPHRFAIEWGPDAIRWFVDDRLVHERCNWDPTPVPQLPMSLHANLWPSRSRELAGRLMQRQLPATAVVTSMAIAANLAMSPNCTGEPPDVPIDSIQRTTVRVAADAERCTEKGEANGEVHS